MPTWRRKARCCSPCRSSSSWACRRCRSPTRDRRLFCLCSAKPKTKTPEKRKQKKKKKIKGWWAKGGRRKLPALCIFVFPVVGSGAPPGTACAAIRSGFAAAKRIHECSVIRSRQDVTRSAHSEHGVFL